MEGRGGGGGGEGGRRSADNRRAAINRYRRRPLLIFCPEKWGGGGGGRFTVIAGRSRIGAKTRAREELGPSRGERRGKKKRVSTSFVHTNAINGVIFDFAGVSKSRPRNLFPFQNVPPPPSSSSFLFFFFASKQRFRSGISNRRRGGKEEGEEDGFRSWKFVLDDRWGRGVGEAQRNRRTWIDDGDAAAVRERSGQAIEGGEAGGERFATLHSAGAERSPSRRNVEIITRSTDHAKYKYNCKLEIITRSTEI